MQNRSALWKEIVASGSYRLESVAEIDGVTYVSISAPVINRALMTEALSVGNCASATLQFSILTDSAISQAAEITIKKRVSDGARYSEWLSAGTFYISQRQDDKVTNQLVTLTCYDAMRKTSAAYPLYEGDESDWPKTMATVITQAAARIGVEVDDRTWLYIRDGPDYAVPRPEGLTIQKVLSHIAGAHGGNFYITQDNRLRFIPLLSGANAEEASDKLEIAAILGRIQNAAPVTVTGVSITNGQDTFTAGDTSGDILTVPRNPYATQTIADDLFAQFGGTVYAPYQIEKGLYDPAAELGDYVVGRDDVRSVLYSETAYLNLAYRGDISAPFKSEIGDEYPYKGKTDELDDELQELVTIVADKASIDDLTAIQATIDNLSASDIKTGIIHSNDYQYAPFPMLYPSAATYPSATTYPSNGEYVLRGFAIDFASGTIYGAFYSEQIYALQEDVATHAAQLEAIGTQLDDLETAMSAVQSRDSEQEAAISGLQTTVSNHTATIGEHTSAISTLQGTVATQSGDISTLKSNVSGLQSDVSGLSDTVSTHGTDIDALKSDTSGLSGRLNAIEAKSDNQGAAISDLQDAVSELREDLKDAITSLTAAINAVSNALVYPKSPPQS